MKIKNAILVKAEGGLGNGVRVLADTARVALYKMVVTDCACQRHQRGSKNCHDYRRKLQLQSLGQTDMVSRSSPLGVNTVLGRSIIQCLP